MAAKHRKDPQPQQYQNILLPVVVTSTSAHSPTANTQQSSSAPNNHSSSSFLLANDDCASANRAPSMQITCDIPNLTTISAFTTNIEQSARSSDDKRRLDTTDDDSVAQSISGMQLNGLTANLDWNGGTMDNNKATVAALSAATRIPFELLECNSLFSSAFPSLNTTAASSNSTNPEQRNVDENAVRDCNSSDALDTCELASVVQCNLCQKKKKSHTKCCKTCNKDSKSKKSNWSLRLGCAKLRLSPSKDSVKSATCQLPSACTDNKTSSCTATSALSTVASPSTTATTASTNLTNNAAIMRGNEVSLCKNSNVIFVSMNPQQRPLLDFSRFNSLDYPTDDSERRARMQRAMEIEEGIDPPPGFTPSTNNNTTFGTPIFTPASLLGGPNADTKTQTYMHMVCASDAALRLMLPNFNPEGGPRIHSQVDFIHCLVRDLNRIFRSSFYFGKLDRFEAERLLDGKEEGTFLLRDSAQEDYLFSVSFRKYNRSLHARIEQFNHKFSFDCHDPGVYTSSTVTGLLEHYKDPACVMFFEPALTLPLNRNFPFSLQQLCRATIVSNTTYDGINSLTLPKQLKAYLKEYHYKQRVRVKKDD